MIDNNVRKLLKVIILMSGLGHSAVLRTLPLSGSLNSEYTVRYRSPKPFATLRASHTCRAVRQNAYQENYSKSKFNIEICSKDLTKHLRKDEK